MRSSDRKTSLKSRVREDLEENDSEIIEEFVFGGAGKAIQSYIAMRVRVSFDENGIDNMEELESPPRRGWKAAAHAWRLLSAGCGKQLFSS